MNFGHSGKNHFTRKSIPMFWKIVLLITFLDCHSAFAQVEVRNEPRHKNVFENDYLRILDVHIRPGDTTLYHRHALPSVIVMLSSVETGSQLLGGSPSSGKSRNGNTWYAGYGEKPIVHRVWNQDSKMFHVMDIELFLENAAEKMNPLNDEAFKLVFQEKGVNAYSMNLLPSKEIKSKPYDRAQLLVCTSGKLEFHSNKKASMIPLENGGYVWIDPGETYRLVNSGEEEASADLIELPGKYKN